MYIGSTKCVSSSGMSSSTCLGTFLSAQVFCPRGVNSYSSWGSMLLWQLHMWMYDGNIYWTLKVFLRKMNVLANTFVGRDNYYLKLFCAASKIQVKNWFPSLSTVTCWRFGWVSSSKPCGFLEFMFYFYCCLTARRLWVWFLALPWFFPGILDSSYNPDAGKRS